jgi:hypothetical protein
MKIRFRGDAARAGSAAAPDSAAAAWSIRRRDQRGGVSLIGSVILLPSRLVPKRLADYRLNPW